MREKSWVIWMFLLLPLAACGENETTRKNAGQKEAPAASAAHGTEHRAGEEGRGGEGLLTLHEEVLRELKLTTSVAQLKPSVKGVTALGELKVNEQAYAEVGAPIAGRVVRLLAAPGQRVRRGQPLAELRSVELGQARAQRTAARAREELARKTAARKRGLAAERIVSRGELQRAEADLAGAQADLQAAEAAVAALGVGVAPGGNDLSGFALLSPLSGTVLERSAVQGQMADPSRSLFQIADLSRLWLIAQVAERDASRVTEGSPTQIVLAALPGQTLHGTVAWVGDQVDPHSRTVPVRIDLPNPGARLKPGMFATASIDTAGEGEKVVAVPTAALQRSGERWVVFLPLGEGRFEARPVERGRDRGDEVTIVSGLKPGERIVVEGAFVLRAEAEKQKGGGEHHDD